MKLDIDPMLGDAIEIHFCYTEPTYKVGILQPNGSRAWMKIDRRQMDYIIDSVTEAKRNA